MENQNYAAIDIGSNGARLLIKNVCEDNAGNYEFSKVFFLRIPLRLGKDVFTLGEITEERERMMMCTIKSYKQLMKLYNVKKFRACATSAMRDASNGQQILNKIAKKTGINIEIINGKEEASLLYNNCIEVVNANEGTYAFVDVGGGSTEISIIHEGELVDSCSYNIGTLRLLGGAVSDDVLPEMKSNLTEHCKHYGHIEIIGSGGNINKLCKLFHESQHGGRHDLLPVKSLAQIRDAMKPMTFHERMEAYSLKADRADVILPAAEIFLIVSEALGCDTIRVPNISLADSIIDGLYKAEHHIR